MFVPFVCHPFPFSAEIEVSNNIYWIFVKIFDIVDVTGDWINDCVGKMNIAVKLILICAGIFV